MTSTVSDLARRLSGRAEDVCRHYLSRGRRHGRYWLVGDVANSPGRSLYVRLHGGDAGPGATGKWTDAATGQHGDLLDLIAANRGLSTFPDTLDEARSFLSLPRPEAMEPLRPVPAGSPEAARRLFAISKPVGGTVAEAYLCSRGITSARECTALLFHPDCFYRPDEDDAPDVATAWPALIAAVTDLHGTITGVHRTWLHPTTRSKAPVVTPRRAMGNLLGHGVRFGVGGEVCAVGEGLETMLSLRQIMPTMPMVAALSATHLAALTLPPTLRRLYIARDNDPAGHRAAEALTARAQAGGTEVLTLTPSLGDFNDDLRQLGPAALASSVRVQLAPDDVARFWKPIS